MKQDGAKNQSQPVAPALSPGLRPKHFGNSTRRDGMLSDGMLSDGMGRVALGGNPQSDPARMPFR